MFQKWARRTYLGEFFDYSPKTKNLNYSPGYPINAKSAGFESFLRDFLFFENSQNYALSHQKRKGPSDFEIFDFFKMFRTFYYSVGLFGPK